MAGKKKKKIPVLRLIIQIFFFSLILLIAINHTLGEEGKAIPILSSASLHALCPFGGVVSIYEVLVSGTFVKKIHQSSFILMWIAFIVALFFGPAFCGWICPLGSLQEWVGKLGKKIFKKKCNNIIPHKLDSILRYLRYAVLAWVVYVTAITGKIFFQDYDPYFALFNFWTSEVTITSIIILIIVLLLSIIIERSFCKYACPYGAVLGIFNLFRIFKIKINKSTCIHCKACDKACPMNIKVESTKTVIDHQCITCLKCTSEESCPVDNTCDLILGKQEVLK